MDGSGICRNRKRWRRILIDTYSKEFIYHEYIVKHKTQSEIAEEIGCNKSNISIYCRKYGFTLEQWYDAFKLTDMQKDLIIGGTLGDGSVTKRKSMKNSNFYVSHAENQKDYLSFKYNILKDICKMEGVKLRKGGGYNVQPLYYFTTRNIPALNEFKTSVYQALDRLNYNSFVIWLMDDGRLDRGRYYTIGMRKHGVEGVRYAIKVVKDKFELTALEHWNDKEHTKLSGIRFPLSETLKIKKIIDSCDFSEEIHRTMAYKIPSINLEGEVVCQTASNN